MLLINDMKYACESCIKGHRSSSCAHSDRPLFEIKKKGRPVSQCEKCRELRKTKRLHSRCQCSIEKESKSDMKLLSQKSKRYIPILPALPNGLKDANAASAESCCVASTSAVAIDEDTDLVQACGCRDKRKCKCKAVSNVLRVNGLEVLAKAAESRCSTSTIPQVRPASPPSTSRKKARSCCSSPNDELSASKPNPMPARISPFSFPADFSTDFTNPFDLPPILETSSLPLTLPPLFPTIPSLNTIISLAGTGCTCGVHCRCPGCAEHRGQEHAEPDHTDCGDDCRHCVDNRQGVELPPATGYGSASVPGASDFSSGESFIDRLIARAAAAIPPPPSTRSSQMGTFLDPMNVTVYPQSLFADDGRRLGEQGPAFGLVRLPKLQCCAGKCGCPGDRCGCGENCNGCCSSHHDVGRAEKEKEVLSSGDDGAQQQSSCCSPA